MQVNYSDEPVIKSSNSIFLAGPTPRDSITPSWRPEAIGILNALGFDGVVYVPEHKERKKDYNYDLQVIWEWQTLANAGGIVFWVPRKLPEMPAFTTNVEFGLWIKDEKSFYGRPSWAEKKGYLDKIYRCFRKLEPVDNLQNLLSAAYWHVKIKEKLK
jgi:hypothetical protein